MCQEQAHASNDARSVTTHYLVQQSIKQKQLARFTEALCNYCLATQIKFSASLRQHAANPEFTANRRFIMQSGIEEFLKHRIVDKLSPA